MGLVGPHPERDDTKNPTVRMCEKIIEILIFIKAILPHSERCHYGVIGKLTFSLLTPNAIYINI